MACVLRSRWGPVPRMGLASVLVRAQGDDDVTRTRFKLGTAAKLAKAKIPARITELLSIVYDAYIEGLIVKYRQLGVAVLAALSMLHLLLNAFVVPRLNESHLPAISRALTKSIGGY